jgi:hypothetical protein
MVRPCKDDTRYFSRPLSDADRAILMAAGRGDISVGFREVLAVYADLWHAGFRPGDDPLLFLNANHSHLDS